ncbi:TonB-dependent receptor [bacterium]|nr:TonB-dependent receptor [bacterium]
MKHVYKIIMLLLISALSAKAQVQMGTIKVEVQDENGDGILGANVAVYIGEKFIKGDATDPFGLTSISGLEPGTYTVKVTFVGYKTYVEPVDVTANGIASMLIKMDPSFEEIPEVVIVEKKEPIIKDAYGGTSSKNTEEIGRLPVRGATGVIAVSGGVQSVDGGAPVIRGGRSDQVITYIDGMPVRGDASVAVSSYGEIQVYQSGIPAEFGDATSGVVNITTRRPSNAYFNRVEAITSQGLDGFGYNTLEILSSGPLKRIVVDSNSGATAAKLSYLIGGTLNYRLDPDPSPIGVLKVNEDKINAIRENPLRPSPISGGYVSNSDFLMPSDWTRVKVKPNTKSLGYNFNGKIDWSINDNLFLTIGGRARRFSGNDYSYANSLLNYDNNSQFKNDTYAGYIRLKQYFKSDENALIQNAGYYFQVDYTHYQNTRWDPRHQDNVFEYGYVGKFDIYQQKYRWENQTIYGGTDSAMSVLALYEQETPNDTAVRFTPGTANPTSANYTKQFYRFNGSNPSSLSEIQQNGALINGYTPPLVYSLWSNVGTPYSSYAKQSEDQLSVNFALSGKIKNHNIKVGFRYEQRTLRYYGINATGLWNTMRQSVNRQIKFGSKSLDSAIYVFSDGEYHGYELSKAKGTFLDTVKFPKAINASAQTSFDKNFRQYLIDNGYKDMNGNAINQYSFINPDAYDPSTFKLSWFSADDLLQNGTVSYYGYDHLGNKVTKKPSLDDYLKNPQDRLIAPYNPIYFAGYIQDEVIYNKLNLRLGLRVDRFDANQSVLKDEYNLYPTKNVSELANDPKFNEFKAPDGIGSDYVVYVDDPYNPTKIVGFRDGNNWYNADGSETNDPSVIAQQSNSGTIAPYTYFKSKQEQNQIGLTSASFKDYKPQINIMPRVAVSFPISDRAMFFANYDVLTQRPQSGNIATVDAYYYLPARSTNTIGNPNLLPEKTISYELGFQQRIGDNMAVKVNAYYKELRNMIQITPRRYAYPIDYITYGNIDFGTVKGFIFNYVLRPSSDPESTNKNVTLEANYTLQFANATGSSSTTQASLINAGQTNLRSLQPTNQDRRHNFVLSFDYRYGHGSAYNGFITNGGKKIFQDAGINFIASALSGSPYSGQKNVTQEVAIGVQQRSTIAGTVNGNRYPWLFNIDMKIDKSIPVTLGKKKGDDGVKVGGKQSALTVYLWVQNLFNTRNIISLYRYTGLPDDDGWLNSSMGQQQILLQTNQASYQALYNAKVNSPSNYTRPRLIRIGAVISF